MSVWMALWLGKVPLVWLGGTYKIILWWEQTRPQSQFGREKSLHSLSLASLWSSLFHLLSDAGEKMSVCFDRTLRWHYGKTEQLDVMRGGDFIFHRCGHLSMFGKMEKLNFSVHLNALGHPNKAFQFTPHTCWHFKGSRWLKVYTNAPNKKLCNLKSDKNQSVYDLACGQRTQTTPWNSNTEMNSDSSWRKQMWFLAGRRAIKQNLKDEKNTLKTHFL